MADLSYRKEISVKLRILHGETAQDEALRASCPVVWILKDELRIADNKILCVKQIHKNIWITNEGVSLDERGKLKLCGPPPESSK